MPCTLALSDGKASRAVTKASTGPSTPQGCDAPTAQSNRLFTFLTIPLTILTIPVAHLRSRLATKTSYA
jgi:hypothetical protein